MRTQIGPAGEKIATLRDKERKKKRGEKRHKKRKQNRKQEIETKLGQYIKLTSFLAKSRR